ncbi:arsenic resistance N-acetyltransferase ArsN2 [Salinigranum sp. GCM10025319]|uniref:arsenic resistance N-acetyltransferase ArsN2 n=1 Tax=Salinigranum sp. GCM10025319 TaxID=3252687 RepID=UPI003618FE4E
MTEPRITLRRADAGTVPTVVALLEANDLPSGDVRSKADRFYLASLERGELGADPVGVGGIEVEGRHGLLRSVVVRESARGRGIGTALCDALEARAAAEGVETLFLLTTTAADFFAERGYERVERSAVPPEIRGTSQFAELCPATATCMRTSLSGRVSRE